MHKSKKWADLSKEIEENCNESVQPIFLVEKVKK